LFIPRSGKTKGHVSDLKFPRYPGAQHRVWNNAIKSDLRDFFKTIVQIVLMKSDGRTMTTHADGITEGKILILATESCAYPGANSVGQAHSSYPANTYILRVRAPVLFPEQFYLDCFKKGVAGIIIMSCGEECPYEGAYHALAKRLDRVYALMKEYNLDMRRLRLTAICTVCNRAFLKEINDMNALIQEIGLPVFEKAA
jgi:coenzyme F420-reducing hydrogenase delta subunit